MQLLRMILNIPIAELTIVVENVKILLKSMTYKTKKKPKKVKKALDFTLKIDYYYTVIES